MKADLTVNACSRGREQSPINVRVDAISTFRVTAEGVIKLPMAGTDTDRDGDLDE